MFLRILLLSLFLASLIADPVPAGTLSEGFLSFSIQSIEAADRAAKGGIQVSVWVIIFYIFYLGVIWSFNAAMLIAEPSLPRPRARYARYLCRANIFLAAGDTGMFIAFLIAYLFPGLFATPEGSQKLMQLLLLGVFSTSLTMSVYYFYIGLYYRDRFGGPLLRVIFFLILTFFVLRLLVHYNPENVWFSMMLPPGQPNYSAWLRNIPLFIYGLLATSAVLYFSYRELKSSTSDAYVRLNWSIIIAMVALLVSFALYALDVFYSHRIPKDLIWIVYTLKTLAYMVAFFFMWLGEFYYGSQLRDTG